MRVNPLCEFSTPIRYDLTSAAWACYDERVRSAGKVVTCSASGPYNRAPLGMTLPRGLVLYTQMESHGIPFLRCQESLNSHLGN